MTHEETAKKMVEISEQIEAICLEALSCDPKDIIIMTGILIFLFLKRAYEIMLVSGIDPAAGTVMQVSAMEAAHRSFDQVKVVPPGELN